MDQELLVKEQIEAGADFIRYLNDYIPVSVALWIKPAESSHFDLYIASDEFNKDTYGDADVRLSQQLREKRSQWLDPFRVRAIKSTDPIARDAIAFRDTYALKTPMPYYTTYIGRMGIDAAYIYPALSTMASTTSPAG